MVFMLANVSQLPFHMPGTMPSAQMVPSPVILRGNLRAGATMIPI